MAGGVGPGRVGERAGGDLTQQTDSVYHVGTGSGTQCTFKQSQQLSKVRVGRESSEKVVQLQGRSQWTYYPICF